jgi:hypothetical protein
METTTTTIQPERRGEPPPGAHDHSLVALVRELRDETTTLLRQEVQLAKTEMSEKASRLTRNAIYIAAGGLIAYAGLVFLLIAGRDLLFVTLAANGIEPGTAIWLAPLAMAVLAGIIGWILIGKGKSALSKEGLAPEKTMASLREDKEWIQHRGKQKMA